MIKRPIIDKHLEDMATRVDHLDDFDRFAKQIKRYIEAQGHG